MKKRKLIFEELKKFQKFISTNNWIGRENEAVNLFVSHFLMKKVKKGTWLHDASQIGIEVAVPQITIEGTHKRQVRKDLVIWKNTFENCWNSNKDPVHIPFIIIEWKVIGFRENDRRTLTTSAHDIQWLVKFSSEKKGFLGFAITVCLDGKMKVVTVANGKIIDDAIIPKG